MTDLLTQKNTKGVDFQPKTIRQTPPSPWGDLQGKLHRMFLETK